MCNTGCTHELVRYPRKLKGKSTSKDVMTKVLIIYPINLPRNSSEHGHKRLWDSLEEQDNQATEDTKKENNPACK